jgi:hypothetical protein
MLLTKKGIRQCPCSREYYQPGRRTRNIWFGVRRLVYEHRKDVRIEHLLKEVMEAHIEQHLT